MQNNQKKLSLGISALFSFKSLIGFFGCLPVFLAFTVPILFFIAFASIEGYESSLPAESPFASMYQEAAKKYEILTPLLQAYHENDPTYSEDEAAMSYNQTKEAVKEKIQKTKDAVKSVLTIKPTPKATTKIEKKVDPIVVKKKIFSYAIQIKEQITIQEKSLKTKPTTCMNMIHKPKETKSQILEKYGSMSCAIFSLKKQNWKQTNQIITLTDNYLFHPEQIQKKGEK